MSIVWTPEKIQSVLSGVAAGKVKHQIASEMSESFGELFTYKTIDSAWGRYKNLTPAQLGLLDNNDIPAFKNELHLDNDNYLITLDYHAPFHSVLWHNRSILIAQKFGLKKIIIVGDLFDCDFAKKYPRMEKSADEADEGLDFETAENRKVMASLDYFDHVYLIKGNHEDRIGRKTDGIIQAKYILSYWGREVYEKKCTYSVYDKLYIGDKWLLVHPKSYSQISGQVARKLASKFHRNIINAHGHFLSYGYDVSDTYQAIDLGGMFDKEKIEYISKKTTTHPAWNNGFGMLWRGHLYFFDKNTDWDFWLGTDGIEKVNVST